MKQAIIPSTKGLDGVENTKDQKNTSVIIIVIIIFIITITDKAEYGNAASQLSGQ